MKQKLYLWAFLVMISFINTYAQDSGIDAEINRVIRQQYNSLKPFFDQAYDLHPGIPAGTLEAFSYVNTRFYNLVPAVDSTGCGMPRACGVMGLIFDGKGVFRENGNKIARLSGLPASVMMYNPQVQVEAFANAYEQLSGQSDPGLSAIDKMIRIYTQLSEIPVNTGKTSDDFALKSQLYELMMFFNSDELRTLCGITMPKISLGGVFGTDLGVLSSARVYIENGIVRNERGDELSGIPLRNSMTTDYLPALWQASPNYSSRNGTAISAIVIHDTEGSYAGSISWLCNTASSASAHYCMRSSDGQVTQLVLESDKAWHARDENPYTIGIEHEGYIANPAYYTTAMYQSSASLVMDICNSGYGINPLRMFYRDTLDDGTVLDNGVHVLAGSSYCVKIAGHQHYPNNTHVDPGPYWNWNYYYKLVNNSTVVTTLNTETGGFYDTGGGAANYQNDERKIWTVSPPGATSVTLTFSEFDLEDNYDFMYIYDGSSVFSPLIGRFNTLSPGTVVSTGGSITVEFRSDCATTAAGWSATWTSAVADIQAPETTVSTAGLWKTSDFAASFTDADNAGGSGIQAAYYQVLENNAGDWRANSANGFFSDNFDQSTLHADWTSLTGNWSISGGTLYQSDTTNANTNVFATLNQDLSARTLFHFRMNVPGGNKTNKRVGLHFYSSNSTLSNRGDGFFIFFRLETSKLEFYRVSGNTYTQVKVVDNVITDLDTWYDVKLIYDRQLGKIWVYRDEVLLSTYTDSTPFVNGGNSFSFRTGNSRLKIDEIKIYRSRTADVTVSVGPGSTHDIRTQNPDPLVYGAKIKSIVQDNNDNLSLIYYHDLNVDYTLPSSSPGINDGVGTDADTVYSSTIFQFNWLAADDANSAIASYEYCISTNPGDSDVVAWTATTSLNAVAAGLALTPGQHYYAGVRSINGAGLKSPAIYSDGVVVATSVLAGFNVPSATICSGDTLTFTNSSSGAQQYFWEFQGGQPAVSTEENPVVFYPGEGQFDVRLYAVNAVNDTAALFLPGYINVLSSPVAAFTVQDSLLYYPTTLVLFENLSTGADTYTWSFGDGTTSDDENPYHVYPDATGMYSVNLKANSSVCGSSDSLQKENYIVVTLPDGINSETPGGRITVFPVPAHALLNLLIPVGVENVVMQMSALDGKTVLQLSLLPGSHAIDVSTFPRGEYILTLQSGQTQVVRIVLQ